MRQFDQMKDAHKSVYKAMKETEAMLNDIEGNAMQIAQNISRLAGTLKIHLSSEDRYLYPSLMESDKSNLKNMADRYQKEMGGLSQEFMTFKDKYNTSSKLKSNVTKAKEEITAIFRKIEKRIQKEDQELYPLAEKVI